jgi:hypothetical protein
LSQTRYHDDESIHTSFGRPPEQPGEQPERRRHLRYRQSEDQRRRDRARSGTTPSSCIAGSWIADRDPTGADRFYRAMVRRNRAVDFVAAADAARWFPDPEQCSLRAIDFGQPPVVVASEPPPSPRLSRRERVRMRVRKAGPWTALLALFVLAGVLLIPPRR